MPVPPETHPPDDSDVLTCWQGVDGLTYVRDIRAEWDEREAMIEEAFLRAERQD